VIMPVKHNSIAVKEVGKVQNNDNNIYVKIRFLFPSLTKREKKIAQIVLDEKDEFVHNTMIEVAKKAHCSDATIVRFCRRLGLDGFVELKTRLEDVSHFTYDHGKYLIQKDDSLQQVFEKIIWYYERTLRDTISLYNEEYERSYEAIRNAKSLHFFGIGDAWTVCQSAMIKFLRIGIPCSAHSDLSNMLSTACMLHEGDVAIGISFSGDTKAVIDCLRIAKENHATTIAIVHYEKQRLSKFSDIDLYTATIDLTDAHDEIARRVAEHAIIETLYMKLITDERDRFRAQSQKSIAAIIANKK
jgi:RpiR family transcriptional regulator, carbohydrate utilization regulator